MFQDQQGKENGTERIGYNSQDQSDQARIEFFKIGCSFINNLLSATYQHFISNEQTSFVTPEWFRNLNSSYGKVCNEKERNPAFFYKAITSILITLSEKFDKEFALQIFKQALRSTSLKFPGKTSTLNDQFKTTIEG